jgi:hypothetical protein
MGLQKVVGAGVVIGKFHSAREILPEFFDLRSWTLPQEEISRL